MVTFSPENIRAEVEKFWTAFTSKSTIQLAEFYAHDSSVFGSLSTRSEPGRLAATRREREYFGTNSVLRASHGEIEVTMLGDQVAIACYTFQFHAAKLGPGGARSAEEHIERGRATQVFSLDYDGQIRIFHEHLSLPTRPD